jgi:CHAT domain-containing protein/tetratricopeptide (TPR) repeat protein
MAGCAVLTACSPELSPARPVGAPATVAITGSTPVELQLDAPGDEPLLITLTARDVDIRASIVRAGMAAATADAPNRRMGVETLLVEPPHEGSILLRIERNDHRGAQGSVALRAVALPARTPGDRRRLEAARLEARACLAWPDPAQGEGSAEAFTAAASLHRDNADALAAGLAVLHAAGARYARLNDWQGAAELADSAAGELQDADADAHAAFAMRVAGAALSQRANAVGQGWWARHRALRRGRELLGSAAARFESLGMPYEAGYAINYRGVSYLDAGERDQARSDFDRALGLFQAADDAPGQALSYQSLALLSHEDGRLADAVREFDDALALIPRGDDPESYAHTLHNSALPLRVLGRFDEAIARHYQAGRLLRELGDTEGEARALHGLGTAWLYSGEPDRAAESLRAAIRLRGTGAARREQAASLLLLGRIERDAGRPASAVPLDRQALALAQAPHDQAQARLALARDGFALGDPAAARRELDELQRLDLPRTHRYLGQGLTLLGAVEAQAGRQEAADDAFARAIAIHDGNGSDLELADVLQQRSQARLGAGEPAAALADADRALALIEAIGRLEAQAESRASFRARYRSLVELRLAALVQESEAAGRRGDALAAQRLSWDALATSDRSRARMLSESGWDDAESAAVPEELLAQRRDAYELLAGKRYQKDRLLNAPQPDAGSVERLTREIAWLRTQAALADERIAKTRVAAGRQTPATGEALRRAMPPGTLVAEFFLGATHGWLFEARASGIAVHRLPDPAEIDRLARQLHLTWRAAPQSQDDRLADASALAAMLFGPLGDEAPAGGFFVIPDAALHLLPMAVLARQAWPKLHAGSAFVVPSLSAAAAAGGNPAAPGDRLLAVVADPVYSPTDARLAAVAPQAAPAAAAPQGGGREFDSLRRLPSSAVEARDLIALAGDAGGTLALIGADASRRRLLESSLGRYRILHFATHALADSADPALATLVLSRWSARGEPLDGALRRYDIAQLRLNADLVVLSACDTAIGREVAGEGLLGLSQAFLQGGARTVVASLWQVPDRSTARLMREFYVELLDRGRSPAVALELAQRTVRAQPRWSDPYYWAGFQLVTIVPFALDHTVVATHREST